MCRSARWLFHQGLLCNVCAGRPEGNAGMVLAGWRWTSQCDLFLREGSQ